jgi:hypothetical protein
MKSFFQFLTILLLALPSVAQIEFIPENYFPADLEFEELQAIKSEDSFTDPERLSGVDEGSLIREVGFDNYERRTYALRGSGELSVEIVTLTDFHAAYSLLTLLRTSAIQAGPPGDSFASAQGSFLFCHGKKWIRIRSSGSSRELLRRIATSISNRMGEPKRKTPSLISYFPESGLEIDSLEYYPGPKPFEAYTSGSSSIVRPLGDMEIARARYAVNNQDGTLSLLEFPTSQLTDEYFSTLSSSSAPTGSAYLKKIGPLLCVLEGGFSSDVAVSILENIQFSYSVLWNQEKAPSPITWGIPVPILNTTVLSFLLSFALCIFSIVIGAGIAGFRLLLRHYVPQNPLDDPKRTEITRLKLP